MSDNKPSFTRSVASGIKGFFKGIVAGGVVGAITGGIVGTIAAIFMGPAAILGGALIGGAIFAPIGSIAGTTTEVVKSREAGRVNPQDIVNAVNISFAQGVTVGHQMTIANPAEATKASDSFRKLVEERRAQAEKEKAR